MLPCLKVGLLPVASACFAVNASDLHCLLLPVFFYLSVSALLVIWCTVSVQLALLAAMLPATDLTRCADGGLVHATNRAKHDCCLLGAKLSPKTQCSAQSCVATCASGFAWHCVSSTWLRFNMRKALCCYYQHPRLLGSTRRRKVLLLHMVQAGTARGL